MYNSMCSLVQSVNRQKLCIPNLLDCCNRCLYLLKYGKIHIAMDFITGLPNSYAFNAILVVVDRLTKYGHFIALKGDYTSRSVAELFMTHVVKLHGMPKSIVSDRDKVFTSTFWKHLFQLQGTTLAMSSAYHPQSDGQSEVVNKCVEMFLRCFTFHNPKAWYKALSWAELWYNTSFHTSIGMSPFKALYGRDPPALIRYNPQASDPITLQEQLINRDNILQQLKQHLERAQVYMKNQADKKRTDVSLSLGDLVLVKLQPYRQHSVTLRRNQKLGMRYFGPFPVMAKIGSVAYKLQLPDAAKIHPVFHISQLKIFKGTPQEQYMPLPLTTTETGPVIAPIDILQARSIKKGSNIIPQVLVQWENTTPAEATWEDFNEMLDSFPNLNLEDKVVINGDGIAMKENRESATSANPKVTGHRKGMRKHVTNTKLKDYVCTELVFKE
jgi:hypothetical protein